MKADTINTAVNELLSLISDSERGTAVEVLKELKLVPQTFQSENKQEQLQSEADESKDLIIRNIWKNYEEYVTMRNELRSIKLDPSLRCPSKSTFEILLSFNSQRKRCEGTISWRFQCEESGENIYLTPKVNLRVDCFDEASTTLKFEKNFSKFIVSRTKAAKEFLEAYKEAEEIFFKKLTSALNEDKIKMYIKEIRKPLPVTKTKVDWDNVCMKHLA
eukprot:maker-scaffold_4-snap-gene-9.60-mRNA-1 protein AED:0.00 eAED:0.00 QI:24/1/1/1/1/1/3/105/217